MVAYFPACCIAIFGEGIYPCLSLNVPRIRSHEFLLHIEQAWDNLINSRGKLRSPNRRHDSFDSMANKSDAETSDVSEAVSEETVCVSATQAHSFLDTKEANGFSMETCGKPSTEQIDIEIDRILLQRCIVQAENENDVPILPPCQCSSRTSHTKYHDTNMLGPGSYQVSTMENVCPSRSKIDIEKIVLNKYVCDFEHVILGQSKQKTIRITNSSSLSLAFRVDKSGIKGTGFLVEPEELVRLPGLPSNKSVDLHIMLKTDHPRFIPGLIECYVPLLIKEVYIYSLSSHFQ
eukprot:Gb_10293 [translate_table: standard]